MDHSTSGGFVVLDSRGKKVGEVEALEDARFLMAARRRELCSVQKDGVVFYREVAGRDTLESILDDAEDRPATKEGGAYSAELSCTAMSCGR